MNEGNQFYDNLVFEGSETFPEYLRQLNLENDSNLLVLSSRYHFYYDQNDLKGIKILVNLKRLNQMKHPGSFLHTLFRVLPPEANYIGCFNDSRNNIKNRSAFFKPGMFYRKVIDLFNHRRDRRMDRNKVTRLLNSYGFRVVDIRDINEMTYFNTCIMSNSGE